MVKYYTLLKAMEDYVSKCSITLTGMHVLLDTWSSTEKETLLYYGVKGFDEKELDNYHKLLDNGSDEEIFEYEKQIFDNLTTTQRDNLLKYCTDFMESDYKQDPQHKYPSFARGDLERNQEKAQEKGGYPDDLPEAMDLYWGGGFYQEMQDYLLKGKEPSKSYPESVRKNIKGYSELIMDYIGSSDGLLEDTILWRAGHWDDNLKVGQVKELPCLNATSYQKDVARDIGIDSEPSKDNYMIKIYAPEGTKGCYADAPSLIQQCPEHEWLLGKNQKYIVLAVDKSTEPKTATIKLIND